MLTTVVTPMERTTLKAVTLYSEYQAISKPPDLPSWITDPNARKAVAACEEEVLSFVMASQIQAEGLSLEDVKSEVFAERSVRIAKGAVEAIKHLNDMESLIERTKVRLSLKALGVNAHLVDGSFDFEAFLVRKWGETKSPGTISEIKFMLELLQNLRDWGWGNLIEELFTDRLKYAKFAKEVSVLREKSDAVEGAKKVLEEVTSEMTPKDIYLRQETLAEIEQEFQDTLYLAVELASDRNIETHGPNGVKPTLLKKLAQKKAERTGLPIIEVSKPIVSYANTGASIVYQFAVHQEYARVVERMLEDMFEIRMSDLGEMEREIKHYRGDDKDDI